MTHPIAYPEGDGRSWRCDGCGSHGRACGRRDGHRRAAETVAVHIDECTPRGEDAMPELKTEQVTTHTVTLTATELESLREAARIALSTVEGKCVFTSDWLALARLGLPPTRGSI